MSICRWLCQAKYKDHREMSHSQEETRTSATRPPDHHAQPIIQQLCEDIGGDNIQESVTSILIKPDHR